MINGIGVDIVENQRIEKFINHKTYDQLKRIFTLIEWKYAIASKNKIERLAVRFAVKEAFYKAFGMGIYSEIEIQHQDGKPYIILYGATKKEWEKLNSPNILVSVSHAYHYAMAMIIIEK